MPTSNSKQKKPTPPAAKRKTGEAAKNPVKILLFSFAAGTATLFLSVLVLSFLLEKSPDPNALLPVASIVCTLLTSAVSGSVAAKLSGKGSPWSVLSGLILILFYLVLSLFFDPADYENGMALKTAVVIILPVTALIAGTFSARKKAVRKKR